MQLNSHLHFNGECEAAFKFYEKCLGGKITLMMPHEGTPVAEHPLQETFWAVRFGMLVDQFGIPWIINCGKAI